MTREKGFHLLLANVVDFDNDLTKALDFLKSRNPDGIIVSYGITQNSSPLDLSAIDLPLVTINRDVSREIVSVLPRDQQGGERAAGHLLEQGVRHPAIIAGPRDRLACQQRLEGFLFRASQAGGPGGEIPVEHGDFDYQTGYELMGRLLKNHPKTDGVFCFNDYIAAGAIQRAQEEGRRVPERMKIVGYDDRDFSAFWPTPISTFQQPLEEMGRVSVESLLKVINGETPEEWKILLDSQFVPRRSSRAGV